MLLPLLSALILILQVHQSFPQNLICNGDFQGHTLPLWYWGQKYTLLASNYSCWYNKNGGVYEIKQKFEPPVTSTGELVTAVPYVLCQNVTLEIGSSYQLNFSVVNGWTMSFSTIIVDVNGQWLHNLTALGEFTVATGSKEFVAKATKSRICFDSAFNVGNMFLYPWIGPCLDNITLIKVQPPSAAPSQINSTNSVNSSNIISSTNISSNLTLKNSSDFNSTSNSASNSTFNKTFNSTSLNPSTSSPNPMGNTISIYCTTMRSDAENEVIFECHHEYIGVQVVNMIKDGIDVYFENQLQINFQVFDIQPTSMKIIVNPERSYSLRYVIFVIRDDLAEFARSANVKVQFYVDGVNMRFQLLSKMEKKTIQVITPISSSVMTTMQNAYSILKASFMSFFLIDIISFWNLSLMYNFLNLSAVPLFSKYFLERLQKILFRLDSILQWLLTQVPHLRPYFNFDQVGGRQLVSEYKNGYAWFGSFGISSGYVRNNIEQLLIVGALIVKIGIMTGLRRIRILPKLLRKQFPRGLKVLQIFLTELTGIQILMIASATGTICATGFVNIGEKLNTVLQVLTLLQGIIIIPLCFLTDLQILKRKVWKNYNFNLNRVQPATIPPAPATPPASRKSLRSAYLTSINNTLELLPFTFIPFLVLFNSPQLFLIVNSVLIGTRCWWVCRHMGAFEGTRREKVFMAINLALWVVHHCVYVGFWAMQKVAGWAKDRDWSGLDEGVMSSCSKMFGFVTIFTVLLGGGFQLLNVLCSLVAFIFKVLKKIYMSCKSRLEKSEKQLNGKRAQHPKTGFKRDLAAVQCYAQEQNWENSEPNPPKPTIKIIVSLKSVKNPTLIKKTCKIRSTRTPNPHH